MPGRSPKIAGLLSPFEGLSTRRSLADSPDQLTAIDLSYLVLAVFHETREIRERRVRETRHNRETRVERIRERRGENTRVVLDGEHHSADVRRPPTATTVLVGTGVSRLGSERNDARSDGLDSTRPSTPFVDRTWRETKLRVAPRMATVRPAVVAQPSLRRGASQALRRQSDERYATADDPPSPGSLLVHTRPPLVGRRRTNTTERRYGERPTSADHSNLGRPPPLFPRSLVFEHVRRPAESGHAGSGDDERGRTASRRRQSLHEVTPLGRGVDRRSAPSVRETPERLADRWRGGFEALFYVQHPGLTVLKSRRPAVTSFDTTRSGVREPNRLSSPAGALTALRRHRGTSLGEAVETRDEASTTTVRPVVGRGHGTVSEWVQSKTGRRRDEVASLGSFRTASSGRLSNGSSESVTSSATRDEPLTYRVTDTSRSRDSSSETSASAATTADPTSHRPVRTSRATPPDGASLTPESESRTPPFSAATLDAMNRHEVNRLVDRLYGQLERKYRIERQRRGL